MTDGDATTVSELGEVELIARIARAFGPAPEGEVWSGDDAAVIESPGERLLMTTDAMVEGPDFRLGAVSGEDLGWKVVAVNASDVAAMGGRPTHGVATLCLPTDTGVRLVDGIAAGMAEAAARWGIGLVGGDISRAGELSISLAMLGVPFPGGPVGRNGARPGHVVCVTGSLGAAAGALRAPGGPAAGTAPGAPDWLARLATRHFRPEARVREAEALCSIGVTGMIDVSDGLAVDLAHVLDSSGVGCAVDPGLIPVDEDLVHLEGEDPLALALTGGEDYELLVTLDPARVDAARAALAAIGTPLTRIGTITDGARLVGDSSLEEWTRLGWDHLRTP